MRQIVGWFCINYGKLKWTADEQQQWLSVSHCVQTFCLSGVQAFQRPSSKTNSDKKKPPNQIQVTAQNCCFFPSIPNPKHTNVLFSATSSAARLRGDCCRTDRNCPTHAASAPAQSSVKASLLRCGRGRWVSEIVC